MAGYYHELEAGLLDPLRVDRSVWELLAELLRASVSDLRRRPRLSPPAAGRVRGGVPAVGAEGGLRGTRRAGSPGSGASAGTARRGRPPLPFRGLTVDNAAVSDPYRDERADALRRRYHAAFAAAELPVPVEAIAEDLLGLKVGEDEDLPVSGMLVPARREVWLNARESRESPGRRRFTLAHELGHWVCQCQEGRAAGPRRCTAERKRSA